MMRIAFFVSAFPLVSETFIVRQITGLLDLGHEVDIYAETIEEPLAANPEVQKYGLLARTTPMRMPAEALWEMPAFPLTGRTWLPEAERPVLNAARLVRALPTLVRCYIHQPRLSRAALDPSEYAYEARSLSSLYRLRTLLGRAGKKYDVLHAHFGPVANSFRFARQLLNAPMVVSFHGYDFSVWPRKQGSKVYAKLFKVADAVTSNSEHTLARLVGLGCPPSKLHKLPVGVNLDDFPFRERRPQPGETVRVLTVGRLVEKKGLEYSIRAVSAVREQHPALRYDIIGEGPLRPALERLIVDLDMQQVVTLHGPQSQDAIRTMMAQAHIFVLASVTAADGDEEGQGLVLQEAQASGLPVVATDHDGFSESILPGESGFLVREHDVAALTERLVYMVNNPERWPPMGRAGRAHVQAHYDIRKLNLELVELYRSVVKGWRKG